MKNLIIPSVLLIALASFYLMSMDKTSEVAIIDHKILSAQNNCIDELEESLYDLSTDNKLLNDEISFLREENQLLKDQISQYELEVGKIRKNVTRLELELNAAISKLAAIMLEQENATAPEMIYAANESNQVNDHAENEKDSLDEVDLFDSIVKEAEQNITTKKNALDKVKADLAESEIILDQIEAAKELKEIEIIEAVKTKEKVESPTFQSEQKILKTKDLLSSPDLYFVQSVEVHQPNKEDFLASVSTEKEFSSKSPVYDLIENTTISYEYISCRRDKFGKKIKKLSTKSNNWSYTFLQFNMDHSSLKTILDRTFRIKLLDIDKNEYVKFTANKLISPETKLDIQYTGEAIQCSFYNNQKKGGQNFVLQMYLVDEEEEYLLENSVIQLFSNGIANENYTLSNNP